MNRFFAFWWALGVVLVFGFFVFLMAGVGSAGPDGDEEFDAARAALRSAALAEVRAAQSKLLAGAGEAVEGREGVIRIPVEVAAELVVAEAGRGVPRVTAVPVPGTPAALELMKKQAAELAAEEAAKQAAEPKGEPKAEEDPKTKKAPAAKPGPDGGAKKTGVPKGAEKAAPAKKSVPVEKKAVEKKAVEKPDPAGRLDR